MYPPNASSKYRISLKNKQKYKKYYEKLHYAKNELKGIEDLSEYIMQRNNKF